MFGRLPAGRVRANNGFTLIELCLVIGLLGVMSAFAWPSFQGLHRHWLVETAARDLQQCMLVARTRAIVEKSRYQIAFFKNPDAYRLYKREPDAERGLVWAPAEGRWGRKVSVPEHVSAQWPAEPVQFYANGGATAAKAAFSSARLVTWQIDLDGMNGYARLERK